jgi:hypothetical protein
MSLINDSRINRRVCEPHRRPGRKHGPNCDSSRRHDVFAPRSASTRGPRLKYTAAQLARGTDEQGRFIGPRALDRAERHFWADPARRDNRPPWVP